LFDQPPCDSVSVCPTVVVPETAGAGEVADGAASGVTADEGLDGGDVPCAFVAVTVNVYTVPFASPETSPLEAGASTVTVGPPGDAVTVYELIPDPP